MTISGEVKNRIKVLEPNTLFSYRELNMPACCSDAVIKALNRMVRDGAIKRYSQGKFYKPMVSISGKLEPSREQVIRDLLVKDGKRIGYITGYAIFNKLTLTTRIPNLIEIGARERKMKTSRGIYSIAFVFQRNEITEENIPLLQLLDVIKMIKLIPDTSVNQSCVRLQYILKGMADRLDEIICLAMNYSPGTRALTGALIEHIWGAGRAGLLYESLNPLSSYSLGISEDVLPEIKKWRIK